ncbi:hypothetical protein CWI39_1908p0010, partial [Hamiltosporidium magnivora]
QGVNDTTSNHHPANNTTNNLHPFNNTYNYLPINNTLLISNTSKNIVLNCLYLLDDISFHINNTDSSLFYCYFDCLIHFIRDKRCDVMDTAVKCVYNNLRGCYSKEMWIYINNRVLFSILEVSDIILKGVSIEDSNMGMFEGSKGGVNDLDMVGGVNNRGMLEGGVNIQGSKRGVSNHIYKQQGVNDTTNEQQGVSKTPFEQHPVNNTTVIRRVNSLLFIINETNTFITSTPYSYITPFIHKYIYFIQRGLTSLYNLHNKDEIAGVLIKGLECILKTVNSKEGVRDIDMVGGVTYKDIKEGVTYKDIKEGVTYKDIKEGVTYEDIKEGVNNSTIKQQGVSYSTYKQHPFKNTSYKQQGVNNSTYKQHPLNKTSYKQHPLNNTPYTHHPFNNIPSNIFNDNLYTLTCSIINIIGNISNDYNEEVYINIIGVIYNIPLYIIIPVSDKLLNNISNILFLDIEDDSNRGVNNREYIKGVNNREYVMGVNKVSDIQQGVNYSDQYYKGVNNSTNEQKGVNNSTNEQQGFNTSMDEQHPVNKTPYEQHPFNTNTTDEQHPVNTNTNTDEQHPFNNTIYTHQGITPLQLCILRYLEYLGINNNIFNNNRVLNYCKWLDVCNYSMCCYLMNEISRIITSNGYNRSIKDTKDNSIIDYVLNTNCIASNMNSNTTVDIKSNPTLTLDTCINNSSLTLDTCINNSSLTLDNCINNSSLTLDTCTNNNPSYVISTVIKSITSLMFTKNIHWERGMICLKRISNCITVNEYKDYLDCCYKIFIEDKVKGEVTFERKRERILIEYIGVLEGVIYRILDCYKEKEVRGVNDNVCDVKGVNKGSNKQQGVNISTDEQQGVNISTNEQQGVNIITDEQQGVNISTDEQQGVNITTNTYHPLDISQDEQHPLNISSNIYHPLNTNTTQHPFNNNNTTYHPLNYNYNLHDDVKRTFLLLDSICEGEVLFRDKLSLRVIGVLF